MRSSQKICRIRGYLSVADATFRASMIPGTRALAYYAVILLLHHGLRQDHRAKLAQYVAATDAKNAYDLGSKVYIAIGNMALHIKDSIALAAGLVWDLKQGTRRVQGRRSRYYAGHSRNCPRTSK